MISQVKDDVDSWIKQLTKQDMRVFSGTVIDITTAVNDSFSSAADVAAVILKDASMTSQLLKLANSFHYNPTSKGFSSISRAIMVLGFDQVRALALSLLLVDSLSEGINKEKLTEEMAQSFHAAVQAEQLARHTQCKSPENVFVATLLLRVGNIAFWAFSDDKAADLLALIESEKLTEKEAEAKVLGFSLHQLTQGLSKSWALGELLDKSLSDFEKNDPLVRLVDMGQSLAIAAKQGWETESAKSAVELVAKKLKMPLGEIKDIAHSSAKQAKYVTGIYGVKAASLLIPQPNQLEKAELINQALPEIIVEVVEDSIGEMEMLDNKVGRHYNEADPQLQVTIMQEIRAVVEQKPSISVVLGMVLDGIYRGIGMDRTLFAIISKDGKILTCKYALGADSERLSKEFKINISHKTNVFKQAISTKKPVHISADPDKIDGTLSREVLKLLGQPPYLIMPTIVRGKVIGVFIADRNASNRAIENKDFLSFQQFCMQANKALTFLSI